MIYITQIIYVKEGKEDAFLAFEDLAIPLMKKFGGKLIHRVRPDQATYIDGVEEIPYEIHFISFPSEDDLKGFMEDDRRNDFLHLKEESVQSTMMVVGER